MTFCMKVSVMDLPGAVATLSVKIVHVSNLGLISNDIHRQCFFESCSPRCIKPTPTIAPSASMSAALRLSVPTACALRMNSSWTALACAICMFPSMDGTKNGKMSERRSRHHDSPLWFCASILGNRQRVGDTLSGSRIEYSTVRRQ